jgi:hypothetical protein
MRLAGNAARMGEMRNTHKILVGNPEGKGQFIFMQVFYKSPYCIGNFSGTAEWQTRLHKVAGVAVSYSKVQSTDRFQLGSISGARETNELENELLKEERSRDQSDRIASGLLLLIIIINSLFTGFSWYFSS